MTAGARPPRRNVLRLDLGVDPGLERDPQFLREIFLRLVAPELDRVLRGRLLGAQPVYGGAFLLAEHATRIASAKCALELRDLFRARSWGAGRGLEPKVAVFAGPASLHEVPPGGTALAHLQRLQELEFWGEVVTWAPYAVALAADLRDEGDETLRVDSVEGQRGAEPVSCIRWAYEAHFSTSRVERRRLVPLEFGSAPPSRGEGAEAREPVPPSAVGREPRLRVARPPRVFISYSWESLEHRAWVERVAVRLRQNGIDARIDAWLPRGTSVTAFMNSEVRSADTVLIVCTPVLREKVHATEDGERVTGVGWEAGLVTAEVFAGIRGASRKVIPVLARGSWAEAAPSFLLGLSYIDLSCQETFENEFKALLREITGHAKKPPPLGRLPEDLDPESV